MTELEIEQENKAIAREYKELLSISYQTLNEELHLLKEDLENIMKGFHSKKKDSNELNWFVIFSTILNLILLTYIFI